MYLYKISVLIKEESWELPNIPYENCEYHIIIDLIGKLLHNWRTHNRNNTLYKIILSKLIILCLLNFNTYILCSLTEFDDILKYCTVNPTFFSKSHDIQKVSIIINKIGYTSLDEILKLSKILKFNNKLTDNKKDKNIIYDLNINNDGKYVIENNKLSFIIGNRTLSDHIIAIKYNKSLNFLDELIYKTLLTQSRDNDINNNGVCYISRNKKSEVFLYQPISAKMCMSIGYNFYLDGSTDNIFATYYESSDERFNIVKVENNNNDINLKHLSDKNDYMSLHNVILIKPDFNLA